MFTVTISIPLHSNQGRAFSPEHHAAFEAFVIARFGGCSRLPGEIAGKWSAEGRTYVDALVAYEVALPSLLAAVKLDEVIRFARLHYAQEAIYYRYLGLAEIAAA